MFKVRFKCREPQNQVEKFLTKEEARVKMKTHAENCEICELPSEHETILQHPAVQEERTTTT